MNDIIVFGDIHTDSACYQLITRLLPNLKFQGYTTFYIESLQTTLDQIQGGIEKTIALLEAFPDGAVPEYNKITEEQKRTLKKVYPSFENHLEEIITDANQSLEFNAGRLEWSRARKEMLETALGLDIKLVPVDVADPQSYHVVGGLCQRTIHMLNEIIRNPSSKSVFITGVGHIIDILEGDNDVGWKYSRGVLTMAKEDDEYSKQINIERCFIPFSVKSGLYDKAFQDIRLCANRVIQKIEYVDLQSKELPVSLQKLTKIATPILTEQVNSESLIYTVFISLEMPFRETYATALTEYLRDLGAQNIQPIKKDELYIENKLYKLSYIKFKISGSVFNDEKLNKLSLTRNQTTIKFTSEKKQFLESQIPGLTAEPDANEKILITYTNNQIITDLINNALAQLRERSVSLTSEGFFCSRRVGITATNPISDVTSNRANTF